MRLFNSNDFKYDLEFNTRGDLINHYETVIDSDQLENTIKIPDALKHQKVRIIIMLAEEDNNKKLNLRGAMEKYKNPKRIKDEKKAWEALSIEKHDHC